MTHDSASPSADVLLVTKPLAPPWDDSGKLLPYSIARHVRDVRLEVMVPRGRPLDLPSARCDPLYPAGSSFTVPRADKLRLLWRLLARPTPGVVHFFLSPGSAGTLAARLFRRLRPRVRVVQTVMSLPDFPGELADALFADVIVVWSRAAKALATQVLPARLRARIVHVPPGIEPLEPLSRDAWRLARLAHDLPLDRPVVLYAGDLEFSCAARTVAEAALGMAGRSEAVFAVACRAKTPAARLAEADLRRQLAPLAARGQVRFLGPLGTFHDLLRCVDCQVLPADTTYAKTDLPLVVLEGLSAGVPAIVGAGTPMDELVEAGAALGVPPLDPRALADTLHGLLQQRGSAAALGAAGRAHVLAHHTAAAMAAAYGAIWRELAWI